MTKMKFNFIQNKFCDLLLLLLIWVPTFLFIEKKNFLYKKR